MLGAWACSYMLNDEIQEADDFLNYQASDLEHTFAEKVVLALMGFYVIWTISLYRVYKQVGEQYISKGIEKYEKIADNMENKARHRLNQGLNKINEAGGAPPSSLNLASLDQDHSRGVLYDLLEVYQSDSSLNILASMDTEASSSDFEDLSDSSTDLVVTKKDAKDVMKDGKVAKKVIEKSQEIVEKAVLYTCPILILIMFLWPVLLLLLRCGWGCCCCCFHKKDIDEDFQKIEEEHHKAHHSMIEKAEQQQGIIAALEEQVANLLQRANAITEKASVAIN